MICSSIKQRILFSVACFLLIVFSITAIGTYLYFRQQTRCLIEKQQFSMLCSMATSLDEKVQSAHNMLIATAHELPLDLLKILMGHRLGLTTESVSGISLKADVSCLPLTAGSSLNRPNCRGVAG